MINYNLSRVTSGLAWMLVGAALFVQPVVAQDDGKLSIGFAKAESVHPDEPRWVVCYSVDFDAKENYVGSIIATTYRNTADNNGGVRWREVLKEKYNLDKSLYGGCNIEKSDADAQWRYGEFIKPNPSHPKQLFLVDWQMKPPASKSSSKGVATTQRGTASPSPASQTREAVPPKFVEVAGPNGIIRLSPEVAARNQAAADAYQRELKAHADAVAQAKAHNDQIAAEHAAELAKHAQSVAEAAAEKRAYEQRLAAHAAVVAAQKVALNDKPKTVGAQASTNDDPNRCITSPAIKTGLRGNTEVHVTNGCDQKVDIVICLKRTSGDWLCGARFGILSQRSMSFMSTNATGEIYVDAVTFGSNQKLGRPAGIIK